MSDAPPTYTESLQQQQGQGYGFQPSYGAVPGPAPPGAGYGGYPPPAGAAYPPPAGSAYPPPAGSAYPPQPPAGGVYNQQPPGGYGKVGPGHPGPGGQYPLHQAGYTNSAASYQSNIVVSQYPTQSVVLVGGCPACRVGVLEDDFTCLGVMCAIVFFPLGLLCCLAMRQRRCASCGAVFG